MPLRMLVFPTPICYIASVEDHSIEHREGGLAKHKVSINPRAMQSERRIHQAVAYLRDRHIYKKDTQETALNWAEIRPNTKRGTKPDFGFERAKRTRTYC